MAPRAPPPRAASYHQLQGASRRVCEPKTLAVFDQLVAGESVKRVAAMFDMSEDAVRRVQQRMRDRLRTVIAKQIQREEGPEVADEA